MPLENISSDHSSLNESHSKIVVPLSNMFSKPIEDGVLTRSVLIKGLTNMIRHKEIENYFCFTELTLDNLVNKNYYKLIPNRIL